MNQRTNEQWLADLRAKGDMRDAALSDLRALILRSLPYALSGKLNPNSPEFESLAEEVAQETLLKVLEHLDTFEGRSLFTTWVHKIAVRQALGELRRRRWRDVPLPEMEMNDDSDIMPRELADEQPSPEIMAERNDVMMRIQRIISEELTEKQRLALMSVVMQEMPLEEVAQKMGTNRNAMYKLMHDTRLRLKRRMEAEGMFPDEILAVFAKSVG